MYTNLARLKQVCVHQSSTPQACISSVHLPLCKQLSSVPVFGLRNGSFTCTCMSVRVCAYELYICRCIRMYVYTYVQGNTYYVYIICICTYVYIYIYIYIYIHTYIHRQLVPFFYDPHFLSAYCAHFLHSSSFLCHTQRTLISKWGRNRRFATCHVSIPVKRWRYESRWALRWVCVYVWVTYVLLCISVCMVCVYMYIFALGCFI